MRTALLLGSTLVLSAAPTAFAAIAQSFAPPAASPESSSANYTGQTNGTITNSPLVAGKAFDRFIQIWIENTDCEYSLSWLFLSAGVVRTLENVGGRS